MYIIMYILESAVWDPRRVGLFLICEFTGYMLCVFDVCSFFLFALCVFMVLKVSHCGV